MRRRSNIRLALYLLTLVLIAGYLVNRQRGNIANDAEDLTYEEDLGTYAPSPATRQGEKAFVVASQKKDDVDWLYTHFPDWTKYRYIVDDPKAELPVPTNKGRESMVYLTFIIDNYDDLPDYTLFLHPTRYQWHNDDPDYDGLMVLRNFQLPYLEQEGYVNLRCAWQLGCPNEIKPYENDAREKQQQGHAGNSYYHAFQEIFGPDREVPREVGVSCCAQFGLTRDKVREIKRTEYVRLREWLAKTPLTDAISGRVMEYSWHVWFGKEAVHCPSAQECYCKVFGQCNLKCPEIGMCDGRYILPPFSTLPEGWPYVGWDSSPRERVVELDVPS